MKHYVKVEFVRFQRSDIFILQWTGHSEVCRDFSGRVCGFFGWFTQSVLVLPQGNQTIYWIHSEQHYYISRKGFWFVSGFYFLFIIKWLLPFIHFILLLWNHYCSWGLMFVGQSTNLTSQEWIILHCYALIQLPTNLRPKTPAKLIFWQSTNIGFHEYVWFHSIRCSSYLCI